MKDGEPAGSSIATRSDDLAFESLLLEGYRHSGSHLEKHKNGD